MTFGASSSRRGKLVHQLPGVVTFAYDIRFRCTITCWKGLYEEYTLCHHTLTSINCDCGGPKKCCLGPQNDPGSLGPKKLEKNYEDENCNCEDESCM
jgi:hypothetical protein